MTKRSVLVLSLVTGSWLACGELFALTGTADSPEFRLRTTIRTLTVNSPWGTAEPAGTTYCLAGETLTARVTAAVGDAATRQWCTGWTGSGTQPGSGDSNSATFALIGDAVLTWLWQTQHWLDTEAVGSGHPSVSDGWQAGAAQVTVDALADVGYEFEFWSGDVPAELERTARLVLTMDAPKSVTAHFRRGTGTVEVTTEPNPAPWEFRDGAGTVRRGTGNQSLAAVTIGSIELTWGELAEFDRPTPAVVSQTLSQGGRIQFHGRYQPWDTDADGMGDAWERQIIGADPTDTIQGLTDVRPADDFDGDRESNLAEYVNNTDPTNAASTQVPQNAYADFRFELARTAQQTAEGGVAPPGWSATFICRARSGETFLAGSGTLNGQSQTPTQRQVRALSVRPDGLVASFASTSFADFAGLIDGFPGGLYTAELMTQRAGSPPRRLRFGLLLPGYAEAHFPGYITVTAPVPDSSNVSTTPKIEFSSTQWAEATIVRLDTGQQVFAAANRRPPLLSIQVPAAEALRAGTAYALRVSASDLTRDNTYLSSVISSSFQTVLTTVQILIKDGWNLIALPVEPVESGVAQLFGSSTRAAGESAGAKPRGTVAVTAVWTWDSRQQVMVKVTEMHARRGYWVLATAAEPTQIQVEGAPPPGADTALETGWNLVGVTAALALPLTVTPVAPDIWRWTAGGFARAASALEPGWGYWVYALEPTMLPTASRRR